MSYPSLGLAVSESQFISRESFLPLHKNNQTYRIRYFLFLTVNNILTPPCLRLNAHMKKQLYARRFPPQLSPLLNHFTFPCPLSTGWSVPCHRCPKTLRTSNLHKDGGRGVHSGSCTCSEFPPGGFLSWLAAWGILASWTRYSCILVTEYGHLPSRGIESCGLLLYTTSNPTVRWMC